MATVGAAVHAALDERVLCERELAAARTRQHRFTAIVFSWRAIVLLALLLSWYYASGRIVSSLLVSDPVKVAEAFRHDVSSGELVRNARYTLIELFTGYGIGVGAALVAAALLSLSTPVQRVARPFLVAFYAIPKVALAPLMVMWFGLGLEPKIILAAIFVFFVVFMSTLAGLASVGREFVNVARVMGASRPQLLVKVVFPTAVPNLITALRIAIPGAMAGAIIGEFMAGNNGLGYMVQDAANQFSTPGVFAGILAIVFVVLVMDGLLTMLERSLLKWRPRASHGGGV